MEHKKPVDPFGQDAHAKAQAAIDHATEVRMEAAEERRKKHAEAQSEPRVINDSGIMRCSVCKFPFDSDVKPSLTVAFMEHLSKAHKAGQ